MCFNVDFKHLLCKNCGTGTFVEREILKIIASILALSVSPCRTEEALRLLLDRREAELREAMKLRHALTTLLHMLRNNMTQVRKTTAHSLERLGKKK